MNAIRFGIEIEFNYQRGSKSIQHHYIVKWLREAGLQVRFYSEVDHDLQFHWKLTTDETCGLELVSPPLSGVEGIEQVRIAMDVLKYRGYNTDRRCGLHVHLDANAFSLDEIKRFFLLYQENEDIFDSLVASRRRLDKNEWTDTLAPYSPAKVLAAPDVKTIYEIVRDSCDKNIGDRYRKVNLGAYLRHGTIEIRHHEGTLDSTTAINWIYLLLNVASKVKSGNVVIGNFAQRFESITTQPAAAPESVPTRFAAFKQHVIDKLGFTASKDIKAWAERRGIKVDLRTRKGWEAVLDKAQQLPEYQTTVATLPVDLKAAMIARMTEVKTVKLLAA